MKKLLIVFAGLLVLILLLLGVIYLAIRGKMPVLSDMVFKQVELGVKESPDEMYAFYDKIGYIDNLKGTSPKSGDLVFADEIELDHTFAQSEINSWIAAWEGEWADLPFTNSQIQINRGERSSPLREFPGLQAEG